MPVTHIDSIHLSLNYPMVAFAKARGAPARTQNCPARAIEKLCLVVKQNNFTKLGGPPPNNMQNGLQNLFEMLCLSINYLSPRKTPEVSNSLCDHRRDISPQEPTRRPREASKTIKRLGRHLDHQWGSLQHPKRHKLALAGGPLGLPMDQSLPKKPAETSR